MTVCYYRSSRTMFTRALRFTTFCCLVILALNILDTLLDQTVPDRPLT
jgi:hypothetical protein